MAFKPLGTLLPQQLRRSGIERGVQAARVLDVANKVIDQLWGQGMSEQYARAIAMKHGTLQIASIQAPFRQEITRRGDEITKLVNEELSTPLVKRVQAII